VQGRQWWREAATAKPRRSSQVRVLGRNYASVHLSWTNTTVKRVGCHKLVIRSCILHLMCTKGLTTSVQVSHSISSFTKDHWVESLPPVVGQHTAHSQVFQRREFTVYTENCDKCEPQSYRPLVFIFKLTSLATNACIRSTAYNHTSETVTIKHQTVLMIVEFLITTHTRIMELFLFQNCTNVKEINVAVICFVVCRNYIQLLKSSTGVLQVSED